MIVKSVKVTSKGQIAIPVDIRKAAGIDSGDELIIIEDSGRLLVETAKGLSKRQKDEFREMMALSASAMRKVWDNEDDEVWNSAAQHYGRSLPVQQSRRRKATPRARRKQR